jgi:hypothetical protein
LPPFSVLFCRRDPRWQHDILPTASSVSAC